MASTFEFLLAIILFTLFVKGHGQCGVNNLTIWNTKTDRQIQGTPEWNVMFVNNCNCTLQPLTVTCKGFKTVEKVDPNVFAPLGNGNCIVNGGRGMAPFGSAWFLYADPQKFIFEPVNHQIQCA